MLLCLVRCRVKKGGGSMLVLFSVPAQDGKEMAMREGGSVALWEPLDEVGIVYLCSRFVEM